MPFYGNIDCLRKDFRQMFEKGLFADARLICYEMGKSDDGKASEERKRVEFPVHKAILVNRSKFFAEHFADGRDELEILDVPANVLKIGIAYLYTNELPLDLEQNEMKSLCKASELYDLDIPKVKTLKTDYENTLSDLLEKGRFSDARIVCYQKRPKGKEEQEGTEWEKVVFPVHKCVLSARSKFFSVAFSSGMKEAESGEIEVPPETGFSPQTIRMLLEFIYTAAVPSYGQLDEQALIEVFKAAHLYELHELLDQCSEFLDPTVKNCVAMLTLAHTYENEELMTKALNFLRENKKAVKATSEWRRLMEWELFEDPKEEDSMHASLRTLCGLWLLELPLTLENCCEVLSIAHRYGNDALQNAVLPFMLYNEEAIRETEGWRRLVQEAEEWLNTFIEGD